MFSFRCRLRSATVWLATMLCLLTFKTSPLWAQASPVAITLAATPSPAIAQPGVTVVTLIASNMPAGTITAANLNVTLQVLPGETGPALTVQVSAYAAIPVAGGRITFQVLGPNVTSPTPYSASVSGTTSAGVAFASGKPASLTIDPPAQILSITPSSAPPGQTIQVTITGQYSNYVQGSTAASFGAGIAVGTAAFGQVGPVTVTSPTTAVAQIQIDPSAAPGPRTVTVATGIQQATLPNGFTVNNGAAIILSLNPNSAQQGQTKLAVTITGQFTHFAQGTTVVSFGGGITVMSLLVTSATTATAVVNVDAAAMPGNRNVTATTGVEVATLTNGFTIPCPSANASNTEYVLTGSSNGLSVFSIIGQTGLLQPVAGSPFAAPFPVHAVVDPTGRLVYTAITGGGVGGYCFNGATGALTPILGTPVAAGTTTNDVAVHPSGRFVYAGNEGSLDVNGYSIDSATGALTPLPGSPYKTNVSGYSLAFDPSGTNLFVASNSGPIAVLSVNQVTGALSPIAGSPFPIGSNLCAIEVHPNGHFVYAADCQPGIIWALNFSQGAFTQLPGSPYQTGIFPHSISISPSAQFLYTANTHGDSVSAYGINPVTGALTAISGSPFASASQTDATTVDGTGRFAYAVSGNGNQPATLWSYLINQQNGALSANGPPITFAPTGSGATFVTTIGAASLAPVVLSVSPSAAQQGQQNFPVTITGQFTHWVQGTTTVSFGAGIGVTSLAVNSATSATAVLNIDAGATVGARTVSLTTNSEVVSLAAAFTVVAGTPVLLSTNPNTGQQGQTNLSVTITGQFTHFVPGTSSVSFGAGVTAVSLTVNSATAAAAVLNIDPAATVGPRSIIVTTGAEIAPLVNGFTVAAGTPILVTMSPNTGQQGQLNLPVVITGQFTHFVQGTTTVSFDAGVIVGTVIVTSSTSLTAQVTIAANAALGPRTVTVTTGPELARSLNLFSVSQCNPAISQVIPDIAMAGQANLAVTITGQCTSFAQGSTTVNLGPDLIINSVTVSSPNSLTANVTVPATSNLGGHTVTVLSLNKVGTLSAAATMDIYRAGGFNDGSDGGPPAVLNFTAGAGQLLTFPSIAGMWTCGAGASYNPDGTTTGECNGGTPTGEHNAGAGPFSGLQLSDFGGPLVGMFLDGGLPPQAPPSLRFYQNDASQGGIQTNFVSLSPAIGQVFFVGDGLTGTGTGAAQVFIVPPTASRLFLGYADSCTASTPGCYSDNVGSLTPAISVYAPVLSLSNGFNVQASSGTPAISQVSPSAGQQGANGLTVTITGQFTHFVQGATTANFGAGITVTSLTVYSATSATALLKIDPAAVVGTRNVVITTGTEIVTLTNGFMVSLLDHPPQIISSPPTTRNWTQLSPSGVPPPARGSQDSNSQAYDEINDRLMIFGGEDECCVLSDVWVLANASGRGGTPNWIQTTPTSAGPAARANQSVIYAKSSNRLIVQGGTVQGGTAHFTDTWVLTNANGIGGTSAWIQLPDIPSFRYSHATVYDPGTNRMIIFGGFGGVDLNDVWVLVDADGNGTPNWTQLTPAGTPPLAREGAAGVYDQATNRLIVFGGLNRAGGSAPPYGNFNDVWVLTNANGIGGTPQWIPATPGGTPPAGRFSGSMVYNAAANQALVFGGTQQNTTLGTDTTYNDLWALSNSNGLGGTSQWTQIITDGGPPLPRFYTSVGYSSTSDQTVVAMGRYDQGALFSATGYFLNDAWVLSAPLSISAAGQTFTYQLMATDPDSGDTTSFSLDVAPSGMSINSATGLLQWTPTVSQVGQNPVTVRVLDSGGLSDTQTFQITVMPVLSSVAPNSGPPSQSVSVVITGQGTHFVQGATTANFGPGISVAGGIPGDFGPVTVTSLTSATAQLSIASSAAPGQRMVTAQTGSESAVLANGFTVTTAPAPAITTVSPNSGQQGQGGPVGIVGLNTHFTQGTTQIDFGAGITVSNITVTCPTCLTVQLAVAANAPVGPHDVTVTTGSEVAKLTGGFTVIAGTPILTSMVPAGGQQGQTVTSTITGQYTYWAQGTTQVRLGTGISVTSVTVSSTTSLSVQLAIAPNATVGTYPLTVTTGTEVVTASNVFTVQAATPILYTLNPGGGTQGQQNLSVTITGLATHFAQGTSVATFGAGVTVTSLTVASATSATAIVNIDPAAVPGTRTVAVTTGSESASFTNGFNITASGPIIYTLNPGGSSQGTNLQVQITGLNTHFAQGTSVASFGAGITVTALAVSNATTATATITIDVAAALGPRTVTVTTGTEAASFVNGFTVVTGVSGITQINPGSGPQGVQNLSLAVTAQFTHFVQGTTTATLGAGITVNSVTVTDSTHLSISISVSASAATGSRTVTITTGSEVVSAPGGFMVTAGAPTIISVTPNGATQGAQNVTIAITGQFTNFVQGTTTVSFGGAGVTVNSATVGSATGLTASISLALGATAGSRTVTVTTGTEVESLTNGFTVQSAINQPPIISIAPTWSLTLPGQLSLAYTVTDDGLPLGGTLTVTWNAISGPGNVGFQNQTLTSIMASFDQAGTYVLQISASDTQLTTTKNVTVTVTGTLPPPPTVSITSPTEGTPITTFTNVVGNVASPALASWTLEFHMQNESIFRPFATGTTTVTNGTLGVFDPTLVLNGFALIQLRATDTSGQTTTYGPINVVVTGNQKVGNFTVSFNDLTVPVAGLPIQVIRTYDSRNKTASDFGVGWTLDVSTVRLATNGTLGDNWTETSSGGAFPTYCVSAVKPHIATVTFTDGTTYTFQAALSPSCRQLVPFQDEPVTIVFTPTGVTPPNATLAIRGGTQPIIEGSVPGPVSLLDPDTFAVFDPDPYNVTLPDGRVLQISRGSSLQTMTDLNGNKLTVSPSGIIHSSGKGVSFQRDQTGRITQVTDPNGNAIAYNYDTSNDLTSVKDAVGNVTTFTYDGSHGLLTIVDPRGVQPIKNVYDNNGRLIQHIDAYGNVINYTLNLSAQQELVTDRLGNVTANYYDANGNVTQVTDALGGNTVRTYDMNNNLLTETNPLNETRSYTYDANNNRLTETDPLGHKTTYTYNSRNQVLTVTDALGRSTTNVYDGNGNLTSTKDPSGNTTTYTYNTAGLQTSMTDPLGDVTTSQYDTSGNLTQQTDSLGNITKYTYDANGNRTSQTKTRTGPSGQETLLTSYQYDALNRVTITTYPDGSTTQIQYNPIGKQSVTTDKLGWQTSYTYDLMGRLLQTNYPDGTSESSVYDAEGDRIQSVDRAGRTTTYVYDGLKRLTKTIYPDQSTTQTTYDAAGEVTAVTDARGNVTQYVYDQASRRTQVIDALTHTTAFAYDADGNQTSMTDANNNMTQYQYDNNNRRTKVVYPDGSTDTTAYDALGRTISKTDEAGLTTQYGYDKLGRLTQVMDAKNQITSYTYDEVGDRITQTDANIHTTTFAYDNLGRRTKRTLPLSMSETFTYDAAGNMSMHTDFNGKTTNYTYDNLNRLTKKTPDASFAAPNVTFTYTATGQRQSMTDASGTTSYAYDLRERLLTKGTPQGTQTYTYDAAGNLLTMRSSNTGGTTVDYGYDVLNRLSTVQDNRLAAGTTSYTYDNVGNLNSFQYPNTVKTTYTYNALNRLTNLAVAAGGTTLASYGYTLGAAGNRTAVSEFGGRQVSYTYDSLYRLTGETIAGGSINGTIGYQYDPVGNRLSRTSTVGPVPAAVSTYDANDRLTTDTYDANGNTTASGGNTYGFDFENHLTAENGTGVVIVYDGDGNRVAKTVSGVTTRYLVDDRNLTGYAQVLEEVLGGVVQRVYTYGLNRISQSQASGTSFYGYDGHGNVRLLTDTTGAVTDRYDYDAFGNIISQTGSTPNVYLYSGEQNDPNLGLYYLRARYLNQATGRFLSGDVFQGKTRLPLSRHRYLFAMANPVNNSDPSGKVTIQDEEAVISILPIIALPYFKPITFPTVITRSKEISRSCPDTSTNFFEEEINGTLVLGRGPEGGSADCHVNAQAVNRINWHVHYDGLYVAPEAIEALGEDPESTTEFLLSDILNRISLPDTIEEDYEALQGMRLPLISALQALRSYAAGR